MPRQPAKGGACQCQQLRPSARGGNGQEAKIKEPVQGQRWLSSFQGQRALNSLTPFFKQESQWGLMADFFFFLLNLDLVINHTCYEIWG